MIKRLLIAVACILGSTLNSQVCYLTEDQLGQKLAEDLMKKRANCMLFGTNCNTGIQPSDELKKELGPACLIKLRDCLAAFMLTEAQKRQNEALEAERRMRAIWGY